MAQNSRLHNSDNSAVFASGHGRRSHAFKSDWFQKDLSLDFRHWIISVRLPYSERQPRPSRTFQQRIWR
ncbi:TPA: hypothetical protein ACWP4A_004892 [Escherichia coli]